MKESRQDHSKQIASPSLSRSWRFLDLLHAASARLRTFTAVAVAVAWVPPALLSALRGRIAFLSFLTDYATQTRFLIILPLVILAAPWLNKRLARVSDNLNDISVVPVNRVDLYALLLAAFIPTIPVVIGSIPFDVVARAALKMLF